MIRKSKRDAKNMERRSQKSLKDESKETLQRFPNPEVDEGIKGNAMPRGKGNLISDISLIENSSLIRENSKFEVRGEEMIEKEVRQSGNSGRVYLPPDWVGKRVKIIRID